MAHRYQIELNQKQTSWVVSPAIKRPDHRYERWRYNGPQTLLPLIDALSQTLSIEYPS